MKNVQRSERFTSSKNEKIPKKSLKIRSPKIKKILKIKNYSKTKNIKHCPKKGPSTNNNSVQNENKNKKLKITKIKKQNEWRCSKR